MPLFFTPAGRLSGWPMESEKRQAPWVAQLTTTHLLLQRPHLLFSENKERTFKLTCAARHRAQTLHHRKAKPGETVGYLRSQSQTSKRPLLLRSWQTLELRKEGIVYGCWGKNYPSTASCSSEGQMTKSVLKCDSAEDCRWSLRWSLLRQ